MALDEIRGSAVALEARLVDGDDLKDGDAAGVEAIVQGLEVNRPVSLADRLQHLDRYDPIVGTFDVAIIGQFQSDPIAESFLFHLLPGKSQLL